MKKMVLFILMFSFVFLVGCADTLQESINPSEFEEPLDIENNITVDINENNIFMQSGIVWGMSQSDVRTVENRTLAEEKVNRLQYEFSSREEQKNFQLFHKEGSPMWSLSMAAEGTANFNSGATYYYLFEGDTSTSNKLIGYYCDFPKYLYESPKGGYYSFYLQIKDILTAQYGEITTEDYNWTNEFYREDVEKWDTAFGEKHFSILTSWILEDSVIFLEWDKKDGTYQIKYVSKGYFESLE